MTLRLFALVGTALVLAGCAITNETSIVVGTARSPLAPEQVKLYTKPPARYEEIAIVSADAAHDGASFDLPPEHVTPWQLYILLQQLNTKQSIIIHEAGRMTRRMDAMEQDTRDLVAAWKTGGAVLRVVKWSAIVGAAALSVWKFMKGLVP